MADKHPQLHVPCTRVSDPAICTRHELRSIAWVSPTHLVTRDLHGDMTLWSLDARTCVQRRAPGYFAALSLVTPSRLICAPYGNIELWSVAPAQDLLDPAPLSSQRFAYDHAIHAAAGMVVAAQQDDMVVLRLEDDHLTELHRWPDLAKLLPQSLMPRYDADSSHLCADASTLAASLDGAIHVLSLHDGARHKLPGYTQLLALDATGQRAFVKKAFKDGRVVSVPDGAILCPIPDSGDAWLAQFMEDALVFIEDDATLCLYDLTTPSVRWRRTFDAPIKHLACSPDGRHIALGFVHRVLILDAQTGELAQDGGPQGEVSRLACVERPPQIVASPKRQIWYNPVAAHRWSSADGAYLGALNLQFEAAQADAIHGQTPIDLLNDNRASIVRWPAADAASAKVTLPDTLRVYTDIAITQDGRFLVRDAVIMNPKGTKTTGWGVYLLDLQQTPPTDTLLFSVKKSPSWPALYASASRYAALAAQKDSIELFDLAAAQPLYTLKGVGKGGVKHAVFSPDEGSLVAACGAKIKRWSLVDGEPVWESKHLKNTPEHTVCVTPDGQHVASAGLHHAWITLRSMQTGEIILQLHQSAVAGFTALTFGPDDRLYAAGTDTQLYAIDLPADL